MIDLRYFVVTLVTVFLSLALGLFIGANLPSDQGLWARQDALITALELEFQALRADNQALQARSLGVEQQLVSERELTQALIRPWLSGRLGEKHILLYKLGDSDLKDNLVELLLASGAQVSLASSSQELNPSQVLEGDVVVLLVEDEEALEREQPLVDQLLALGPKVIAACSHHLHEEVATFAQDKGIPYVGHADSPAGKLSLVYLLAGLEHDTSFGWTGELSNWPHPAFLYTEGYHD